MRLPPALASVLLPLALTGCAASQATSDLSPVAEAQHRCGHVTKHLEQRIGKPGYYSGLNRDGSMTFIVDPTYSKTFDLLACMFRTLGTPPTLSAQVWKAIPLIGPQRQVVDGVEYTWSATANEYLGTYLTVGFRETAGRD